ECIFDLVQLCRELLIDPSSAFCELLRMGLTGRLEQRGQRSAEGRSVSQLMLRARLSLRDRTEDTPLFERPAAVHVADDILLITLAGQVDQTRGFLKMPEKIRWR